MKKLFSLLLVCLLAILGTSAPSFATPPTTIYYVKIGGSDAAAGTDWTTAFATLQKALSVATSGDEIWVAKGTYIPGTLRTDSFTMKNGVAIYGGFAGNELSNYNLSLRNFVTNKTTLSGDLLGDDGANFANNADNSYHVIHNFNSGLNSTAILDGFTITGGNANSSTYPDYLGGGVYNNLCSPTFRNCAFQQNTAQGGGAMYNRGSGGTGSTSSPMLTNCTFQQNTASQYGGAMYNGGFSGTSSPMLTNCSFQQNTASTSGGAMYNYGFDGTSSPVLTNCVLFGNGGNNTVFNVSATPTATYSLFDNTTGVNVSGLGNLTTTTNPFVSTTSMALAPCSPAINAGTSTGTPTPPTIDILGNARVGATDMGAYEFQGSLPTTLYVNQAVTASGDGTTWATAFKTLQEALTAANACASITQIWVAKGTYYPSLGVDVNQDGMTAREVTFQLFEGVKVYGGFSGNGIETMLSQRNVAANVTTLSGDIGTANDNSDNACHVVYTTGVTAATVLDGFTVTAGNANIPAGLGSYNQRGGGMLNLNGSSPTVANCTFFGNSTSGLGGGMYNEINSSPNVTNCAFLGNTAPGGGGMANGNSSTPVLTNCTFSGNAAPGGAGGAMYNVNTSSPTLTNCTFSGNSALVGGVMYNFTGSSPILKNCIVWNNNENNVTNTSGASIHNQNGSLFALSSPSISYSIIANSGGSGGSWVTAVGTDGGNNKNSDPLFVDPDGADNVLGTADDNLRLQACSPAINAGTNSGAPATDILGNARTGTTDMGAYEFIGTLPTTLYVNAAVASSGDGTSWATAYKTLQEALQLSCGSVTQIWVAKGTYYPTTSTTDQNASFVMKNNLGIYGGFSGNGTETMLSERDWQTNVTTLSGEIQQDNDVSNNSLNVILNAYLQASRLYNTAILDGFTVTGGNANGTKNVPIPTGSTNIGQFGGGISNVYASPTIANCIFTGNSATWGGGFSSWYSYDDMSIVNCSFTNNSATQYGGGLYLFQTTASAFGILVLKKIVVSTNVSSQSGGGIMIADSRIGFENSVITNNSVTTDSPNSKGGGVFSFGSEVSLFNCTVYGNTATLAGGLHFGTDLPTRLTITNSIFWGNRKAGNVISSVAWSGVEGNGGGYTTYSNLERASGVYTGTGNINQDPLFVNTADPDGTDNQWMTADDGFRLSVCSPAINAGTNTGASTPDIISNPRPYVGTASIADMGAYEFQGNPITQPTASASTTTAVICAGGTINLSASGGDTYSWNGPSGSSFSSTAQNPSFTGSSTAYSGLYTVVVSNTGCTATATATVSVQVNANPTLNVTPPTSQCGGTINLSTAFSSDGSLSYFADNGFSSIAANPVSSSGPYYAKATGTNSCSATASVSITINTSATISAIPPAAQCGGTINLSTAFSTNGSLSYFTDNMFSSSAANPVSSGGIYYAKASVGTCTATASVLVTINPLPVVSINPATSQVCVGQSLALSTNASGAGYSWASSGGTFSSTTNQATFSSNSAGGYSFTVTVSNGTCTNTATASVTVNPGPNISTQPASQTLPEGTNLTLSVVAANATVYQWQKDNANFGSSSASPSLNLGPATLGMSGTYKVIVSGACGSATSSPAIVTVTPSVSFATSNGPAVCIGLTIDLKCQRVGTAYTWLGPDGWTSNLKDPSRGNATAAMGGVYSVSVKSGSLVTSATVSVQLVAKNAVSANSNSPVSVGNAIQLSANGGLAFSKTYAWTGPSSFSSTLQNPTRPNAQLTHKGKYIVTFNGACGTATASISVVVNAATRIASSDEDAIDMEISAYPNPVTNTLTVEVRLAKPAALTLELLNGLGEKNGQWKLTEESTQHKTELDLSTLTGGMYLLQAQAGKQKVVKRVVKIQY